MSNTSTTERERTAEIVGGDGDGPAEVASQVTEADPPESAQHARRKGFGQFLLDKLTFEPRSESAYPSEYYAVKDYEMHSNKVNDPRPQFSDPTGGHPNTGHLG